MVVGETMMPGWLLNYAHDNSPLLLENGRIQLLCTHMLLTLMLQSLIIVVIVIIKCLMC